MSDDERGQAWPGAAAPGGGAAMLRAPAWVGGRWRARGLLGGSLILVLAAGGCGPTLVRNPLPGALVEDARPMGLEQDVRTWGDRIDPADLQSYIGARGEALQRAFAGSADKEASYLAISGGGQYGAFGADVLNAWTETGERPEFLGVSGISTGALIAPFAFLGPQYDYVLKDVYTTSRTEDLLVPTLFSGVLRGAGLADTSGLAAKIAQYVTADFLAEVAAEHGRGRALLVGTTNIDAQRPVIWDMGAIAASGHPDALELFRDVILASASIPVAFPPVLIPVTAPDGRSFDGMHVDGGATSQVTFVSPQVPIAEATRRMLGDDVDRTLYVLINTDIEPRYDPVRPRTTAIGAAAISPLIRDSAIGNVYRLSLIAERDEIDFNVTRIPGDVACAGPEEAFDPVFMRCLYDTAGAMVRAGRLWQARPPYFTRNLEEALALREVAAASP